MGPHGRPPGAPGGVFNPITPWGGRSESQTEFSSEITYTMRSIRMPVISDTPRTVFLRPAPSLLSRSGRTVLIIFVECAIYARPMETPCKPPGGAWPLVGSPIPHNPMPHAGTKQPTSWSTSLEAPPAFEVEPPPPPTRPRLVVPPPPTPRPIPPSSMPAIRSDTVLGTLQQTSYWCGSKEG